VEQRTKEAVRQDDPFAIFLSSSYHYLW
jgi:hypothetical protein